MPYQFQCKVCLQTYKVITKFIEHVKTHMLDNEKVKWSKPPTEENLRASMLQKSIDIKLENEEIKSFIIGQDLDVKELSSQSQESRVYNKMKIAKWCKICDQTFSLSSSLVDKYPC